MNSNEYLLFDCIGSNRTESDLPLLDNNILNEFNEQKFEIDNFLTSVPSNESEFLPEFVSISQNCSFDSISVENSNNQLIDQYNSSSASSSTSSVYSPIQITPPDTPPSCENVQNYQSQTNKCSDSNKIKRISGKSKKSKNNEQNTNKEIIKKKRLLPIAPKTDPIVFVQLSNTDQHQKLIQINQQKKLTSQISINNLLNENNNSSIYNLNNQTVNMRPLNSSLESGNSFLNDEKLSKDEMSKIKEKARRLRNRQSAMLSRQKKNDYVKGIEKRLEELTDENQNLKKENYTLKDMINKLTFENDQLKNLQNKVQNLATDYLKCPLESPMKQTNFIFNSNDATKTKKTISLLAVIFLIGLNMNLYNDNFKTYDSSAKLSSIKTSNENTFKGRVLLWTDNNLEMNKTLINSTMNCSKQNLISQNETLILESKLRNWAIRQQNKQHLYSNFNSNNKLDAINNKLLPWYLGIRNWNQIDENNKQRKLYYTNELNYEQIINSVRPKDDTYYFVSLNPADYLILPLNFYSNTSNGLLRPKFSLLLPALNSQFSTNHTVNNSLNSTNEFTNSNSFLHLIEIDFEVINMKPIQILKNRVHLHNSPNNDRFKRIVRNTFNDKVHQQQLNSTNATVIKPLKSILSKNQTNVQSQFKKPIIT